MAKKRNEPTPPTNPNTTLIVLVAGGLLVAVLVGWALTRQVEPATERGFVPQASTAISASGPSTSSAIPAADPHGSEEERKTVARIAVEDLRAKLNRGEVTVIDVRDINSYTASHIPNALHIPLARIEGEISYLPKDKPIVTYCT